MEEEVEVKVEEGVVEVVVDVVVEVVVEVGVGADETDDTGLARRDRPNVEVCLRRKFMSCVFNGVGILRGGTPSLEMSSFTFSFSAPSLPFALSVTIVRVPT